jgi:hypothetical protein
MIRAPLCDKAYWDKWVEFQINSIQDSLERIKLPSGNPSYRPQYVFQIAQDYWHLIFYRYSRGDAIKDLAQYFAPMLDAWKESERLGLDVFTPKQQHTRKDWAINLDHYIVCFWLVGLALVLEIPDAQWLRLLALIGNEGEDELLDRVIASRQPSRKIGTKLCHPIPYQRLLDTISAPSDGQAKLLFTFVDKWYAELNRVPKKGTSKKSAMYLRPYWYKYHDPMGGAYFGYWCVEAIAAVKAFGLDDHLCLGHPNYPGDLLRPDGPTTHPLQTVMNELVQPVSSAQTKVESSWLSRLLGRK